MAKIKPRGRAIIRKQRQEIEQLTKELALARDQIYRSHLACRAFSETASELVRIDRAGRIGWPEVVGD